MRFPATQLSLALLFWGLVGIGCEGAEFGPAGQPDAAAFDASVCHPTCALRDCGDDGCGSSCGECSADERCINFKCLPAETCNEEQRSVNCDGRDCGPDGCGGYCGLCPELHACDEQAARCLPVTCQPECGDLECGPDPICGASCGHCPPGRRCGPEGRCLGTYPPPPYGTGVGDIIDDLAFTDAAGETVRLSDFYRTAKAIVLVSTSAWCHFGRVEARELNPFWERYAPEELVLLYTLYQDENRNSPGPPTPALAERFEAQLGLDYPILLDEDFLMEPYFARRATPLNMVIDPRTMRIRYREVGYSEFQVTYFARKLLYQ